MFTLLKLKQRYALVLQGNPYPLFRRQPGLTIAYNTVKLKIMLARRNYLSLLRETSALKMLTFYKKRNLSFLSPLEVNYSSPSTYRLLGLSPVSISPKGQTERCNFLLQNLSFTLLTLEFFYSLIGEIIECRMVNRKRELTSLSWI